MTLGSDVHDLDGGATPILLFPGQSAFHRALLDPALALSPAVAGPIVDAASAHLGRDIRGELAALRGRPANRLLQVAVFLASYLHLALLRDAGLPRGPSAGMSLGEYVHLVDIGAIDFLDALALVDERGRIYDEGPEGVMAALFPVEAAVVEEALAGRDPTSVALSNYNSPTQQVIAGERGAVEAVARELDEAHFVESRIIEERLPMHCQRFEPAARHLRPALDRARWRAPTGTYLPNVIGEPLADAGPAEIPEILARHVYQAVRWRQTVDHLAKHTQRPLFVEVGPGQILCNLMRPAWRPEPRLSTHDAAALAQALRTLAQGGHGA